MRNASTHGFLEAEHAAPPQTWRGRLLSVAGYVVMITFSVGVLWLVQVRGESLVAPSPASDAVRFGAGVGAHAKNVLQVLIALLAVVTVARGFGWLFRCFGQPPVAGEIIAGIALGPSLLGRVAPEFASNLIPATVIPSLNTLSQVGVLLFMFLVGAELDLKLLRNKAHTAMAISHASIAAPFLLGAIASFWLYPRLSTNDVPFAPFAMFMGIAMSITAFPVLARILNERDLRGTRLGALALSCAAVDDVTAWCLLAFVVSLASAQSESVLFTMSLTALYIAVMWFAVRPLIQRYATAQEGRDELTSNEVGVLLSMVLLSSLITEFIGIHAIFGAFLLGTALPHDSALTRSLHKKLEDLVLVLLLPMFFAFTGLRTQMGLLRTAEEWQICAVIIALACAGKMGGTFLAGRATGLQAREAASLGALMNTRGLMELVVLNIGLDLHVISPTLFAMMILMAVVTTLMTSPLLTLLQSREEGVQVPSH